MAIRKNDDATLAAVAAGSLAVQFQLAARPSVRGPVEVVEVEGDRDLTTIPRGSMTLVVGTSASPLVKAARAAGRSGRTAGLVKAIAATARGAAPASARSALGAVGGVPVVTRVSYGGKVLVDGLTLGDDEPAATTQWVFAGGRVDADAFRAVHAHLDDAQGLAEQIRTIVVVRQPDLSPFEQAILDRLGDGELNATVGAPYSTTTVVMAAITLTQGRPVLDHGLQQRIEATLEESGIWPGPLPDDTDEGVRRWLETGGTQSMLEDLDARDAAETLTRLRTRLMAKDFPPR